MVSDAQLRRSTEQFWAAACQGECLEDGDEAGMALWDLTGDPEVAAQFYNLDSARTDATGGEHSAQCLVRFHDVLQQAKSAVRSFQPE
jgi:hypothetical protein